MACNPSCSCSCLPSPRTEPGSGSWGMPAVAAQLQTTNCDAKKQARTRVLIGRAFILLTRVDLPVEPRIQQQAKTDATPDTIRARSARLYFNGNEYLPS